MRKYLQFNIKFHGVFVFSTTEIHSCFYLTLAAKIKVPFKCIVVNRNYRSNKIMKFSDMAEELRLQLENPNSDLESFQDRF